MASILDTIAQRTRQRMAEEELQVPTRVLAEQARRMADEEKRANGGAFPFPFQRALEQPGLSFICEVKKASPSKGLIAPEFPYLDIAVSYQQAGAAAISCLTEPYWFLGSDEYLRQIAEKVSTPVLRKDFVVGERMVFQAKVLGASAVLLICSILDDQQLRELGQLAESLGLSALYEAHDASEIARALDAGAHIVGVNNRNLGDFSVDFSNAGRLRSLIPESVLYVAESGVSGPEDVRSIAAMGADAVLVGEALMRSADRAATMEAFRQAAREGGEGVRP